MEIVKSTAPYIRKNRSVTSFMLDVLIALAPLLIFSFIVYPYVKETHTVPAVLWLISCIIMVGSELVYCRIVKHKITKANILAPLVSATIYYLISPAGSTWYGFIIGAFAGIIIGKLVFGGLGSNIFNPAAVGMVIAKLSFGSKYPTASSWYLNPSVDVISGGTPLSHLTKLNSGYSGINDFNLFDMFIGKVGGTFGEAMSLLIIVGLIYLLIRRGIDWRIPLAYLGTFAFMGIFAGICVNHLVPSVSAGRFLLYELLSGGLLFGAVFMFTDPVTSPITAPGRIIFGMIGAVVTFLIRMFAALPEGVAFSILICNMLTPLIDYKKWSSNKYTIAKIIWMVSIVIVGTGILVLGILYSGKVA